MMEFESRWKEAVMAIFKVLLFWHLLGGTEENHETLSQDSQTPGLPNTKPQLYT
jgi:hypothetical protein